MASGIPVPPGRMMTRRHSEEAPATALREEEPQQTNGGQDVETPSFQEQLVDLIRKQAELQDALKCLLVRLSKSQMSDQEAGQCQKNAGDDLRL